MNIHSISHCSKLSSQLALTPYATVKPREATFCEPPRKEHYNVLFSSLFDFGNERRDKIRESYFDALNKHLFSKYDLQTKFLFTPENQNIHQDNLSRFLHFLCTDTSESISKLIPVPSLTNIQFPDLFNNYLFCNHVPPDRASWVIHIYLNQSEMTKKDLTNFIKTYTKIKQKDYNYFIKLIHSLYTKNLLNHLEIAEWLVQNFQPAFLGIFKNVFLNSFKILSCSLNTDIEKHYLEYLELMEDSLCNMPSQMVQLAISMTYLSDKYKNRFQKNIFCLMDDSMKKRANSVINGIKCNNVSLFIKTYLVLSLNFPYYDIPKIKKEFQILFQFLSQQEKMNYILETIQLVHDFPSEPEITSAVLIELYKILNTQNEIKFPLNEFINFLYSNVQFIEDYTYFFYELQYQNFFDYLSFLKKIIKTGKSIEHYEITFKILINLPPMEYSPLIVGKVKQILMKNSKVYLEYERIFNECWENIEKTYDISNVLPPYFIYMIGYSIIKNKEFDFTKKSQLLAQLNLQPLILSIFMNEENPLFSQFSLLQIKHLIPLLYSRDVLDNFIEIITDEKNAIRYLDICHFVYEVYNNSSYFNDFKDKIQNICNKKIKFIDPKKIVQLAYDYSHLFNLFVLNDFYDVKTINDFQKIFFIFLKNLFNFDLLYAEHLWDFFVSFVESLCIHCPFQFFINIFLMASVFGIKINENNKLVITKFLSFLMKKRFFSGTEYLSSIHKIVVSKRIDINDSENAKILLEILGIIVKNSPKIFTFTNLIQDSIANWLTVSNRHLRNIIRPLSSNSFIITKNIINVLHAPPSNYGGIFFYLLPRELFEYENEKVFNYYFQNINYNNMLLWTIWLKNRPLYKIESITDEIIDGSQKIEQTELIVLPNYLFNEYTDHYRYQISNYFINMTSNPSEKDPQKIDVYLESFRLLCDHQKIAKITFDLLINELNRFSVRFSMDSIRLAFYLLSYLNEKQVEVLCKSLLKFDLDLIFEDDSFIFKNSYFFLIIFAKFAKDTKLNILMQTANKILQLIPDVYENQFQSAQFLIDCFNFYIAVTSNKDIQFHNEFMEIIKSNLDKLKGELKNKIILNQSTQIFTEMEEPLYINSLPSSSAPLSTELIPGSNQINDIFSYDVGFDWY